MLYMWEPSLTILHDVYTYFTIISCIRWLQNAMTFSEMKEKLIYQSLSESDQKFTFDKNNLRGAKEELYSDLP